MYKRPLFILLLLVGLLFACQSRYGYLSKVRVGSAHKQKLEKEKLDKSNTDKSLETEEEDNSTIASNDSNIILLNNSLFKNYKEVKSKQAPKLKKQEINKNKPFKKPGKDGDRMVNYYAKWALIMGLITLLTVPFIIPIFLGPVDIFLGIIALKQISKSGEKGIGRAIFAILVGLIATLFLLFVFMESTFWSYPFMPIPVMFLIAIGVLVFNLIMYILIKKGNKNPANKEQVEKRVPLDHRTKRLLKITFVFALLTALFSAIIVGLAFGPITLILSHLALTKMPKDGRNARFITQMVLVLGILSTLGLLVVLFLLLAGFIMDYVFFALAIITVLLAIIITIIAFSIRMNYFLEEEY